jgi:hypothetical protein
MAWAPKVQAPGAAPAWGAPAEPAPEQQSWGAPAQPADQGWAAPEAAPAEGWEGAAAPAGGEGWTAEPMEIEQESYAEQTAGAAAPAQAEEEGGGMILASAADFMEQASAVNTEEARRAQAADVAAVGDAHPGAGAQVLALPGHDASGDEDLPVAVEEEPEPPPPAISLAPPPAPTHDTVRQEIFAPPPPAFPVPNVPPAAAAPAPAFSPSAFAAQPQGPFVDGEHRVVLHTVEGKVLRGAVRDLDLGGDVVPLMPQPGAAPDDIPFSRVKALFFMMAPGEKKPPQTGRRVKVTFTDGRNVEGYFDESSESATGFFIIPLDARTNTKRIWIQRAAVRHMG